MITNLNIFYNSFSRRKFLSKSKTLPHLYMAIFAAGWVFTFEYEFRFYVAELFIIICLPMVAWLKTLRQTPTAQKILGAYVLWIFAILVSDFVNSTDSIDTLRGISTPILGAFSLLFVLAVLSRNPKSLFTFLVVTVVMKAIFGEPLYGDAFSHTTINWETFTEDTNIFKVRIDPFLTPLILLITCLFARINLINAIIFLVLTSILYFIVDSRSTSLVFFLSAIILYLIFLKHRIKKHRINALKIIKSGIVAALIGYPMYFAYVKYTLIYNSEGHGGKQLLQLENPYNPFSLLLVGRSEWLIIPTAVYEKPIFGWGSWAQDTTGRFNYLLESRLGTDSEGFFSIYIPVHSTLGSAWVWSGFLGFIAMLWLLSSILKMAIKLPNVNSEFIPVIAFFIVMVIWHFLFSPPQMVRLFYPIALASIIVLTKEFGIGKFQRSLVSIANKKF